MEGIWLASTRLVRLRFNGGGVDHSIGAPRRWFVTVGKTGKYLAEETRKDAEKLVSIDTLSCSPGEVFLADGLMPLPLVGEQVSLDEVFFIITLTRIALLSGNDSHKLSRGRHTKEDTPSAYRIERACSKSTARNNFGAVRHPCILVLGPAW